MTIQVKQLILAPMEGVVDALMRKLLCSLNDYDLCIAEFIRIVDCAVPKHVFYRTCPELHHSGLISRKTPIRVQLLGQDPHWMAENAVRAIEVGSHGVDLNFGCPAKTVNKSRGGATLLKDPQLIFDIVSNVKKAIGTSAVLSAKIRLGFDDTSKFLEVVDAIDSAGADQLTIHARTKADGYRPPAYWHHIGDVVNKYKIDIIANGEIWDHQSAHSCLVSSKSKSLMLGRGALALPNLANVIRLNEAPMRWDDMRTVLRQYAELELIGDKSFYFSSRLKQWLRYLKLHYVEAELLFTAIKTMKNKDDILAQLAKSYTPT